MRVSDNRFCEAEFFVFKQVLPGLCRSIETLQADIAKESSYVARRPLQLSCLILLFFAIRTMTKFHRFATDTRDDVEHYYTSYFPRESLWTFKKLYRAYEAGLLAYLSCDIGEKASRVEFLDGPEVENCSVSVEEKDHKSWVCLEVFYSDFCQAADAFKAALCQEGSDAYRMTFFHNYEKIKGLC